MNPTLMMVDEALQDCAIIYGSLPPGGRDLDLLVSLRDYTDLPPRLGQHGWAHRGSQCVRFGDFTAYAVDLVRLDRWTPSPAAAMLLEASAVPLEDCVHLRVPAPHHQLLILAHRYAGGSRLDTRKLSLLRSVSQDDWDRARLEVSHWRTAEKLDELYAESVAKSGSESDASCVPRISHRARVISLSGVDGSGKSTQAQHLQVALENLGFESAVEWTKITQDPVVRIIGTSVKRAIAKVLRGVPTEEVSRTAAQVSSGEVRNYPDGEPPPNDAGKSLRRRSRILTWGWAVVVAFGNGLNHWRTVRRAPARVVICDRYVFDSLVHLQYRYGTAGSLRLQRAIVALLSPRPDCTFFLDVPPAVARARKPEQYLTPELAQFSELYHRMSGDAGAIVIDGTRPAEEIAAEVARLAWEQLGKPRRKPLPALLNPRRRW